MGVFKYERGMGLCYLLHIIIVVMMTSSLVFYLENLIQVGEFCCFSRMSR